MTCTQLSYVVCLKKSLGAESPGFTLTLLNTNYSMQLHNIEAFCLLACKIEIPIFKELLPVVTLFSGYIGPDKRIV